GGQPRNSVAALDARTGRATAWDARLAPQRRYIAHGTWVWPAVNAVTVRDRSVFIGGAFSDLGGVVRPGLAALDARTAAVLPFDPQLAGGSVAAVAVAGRTLYVAGALYQIGGEIRPNLAALDITTGRATRWNPRADAPVEMIAIAGRQLFAGGWFSSVHDWEPRAGLAAIDLTTGRATAWAPQANGRVLKVAVAGNRVFASGSFSQMNGVPRRNLVALDGTTGALDAWDPPALLSTASVSSSVSSLTVQGDQLYVGGYFASAGTPPGYAVRSFDVNTADVSTWNVPLDGPAEGVFPVGDRVYLTGGFGHAHDRHRVGIAAVDAGSAALQPWAPELTGACGPHASTLLASGDKVYLGGVFGAVAGVERFSAVAVDAGSGSLLPWNPGVQTDFLSCGRKQVASIAMHDHELWLGGSFTSTGGQPIPYLAVVDDQRGELAVFRPGCDGPVEALLACGDTMFVAGAFQRLAGQPQRGLGMFVLAPHANRGGAAPVAAESGRLSMSPVTPNPVTTRAVLRFTLPASGPVDLAVYDVQGRRASSPLERQTLAAGPHEVVLPTEAWKPGFYFCRLSAGGQTRVQKLLVVR
ncbi:MAG: T9SS type A sorting domain-containing protein, partial [Candidatus Eisenbacteria bacterium]